MCYTRRMESAQDNATREDNAKPRPRLPAWASRRFQLLVALEFAAWMAALVHVFGVICPYAALFLILEGYFVRAALTYCLRPGLWHRLLGLQFLIWPLWVMIGCALVTDPSTLWAETQKHWADVTLASLLYALCAPWSIAAAGLRKERPRLSTALLLADLLKTAAFAIILPLSR